MIISLILVTIMFDLGMICKEKLEAGPRVNCKATVSPTETIVKALKIKLKKGKDKKQRSKGNERKISYSLYQYIYHLTPLK